MSQYDFVMLGLAKVANKEDLGVNETNREGGGFRKKEMREREINFRDLEREAAKRKKYI